MSDADPVRPLTPHEMLAALREARAHVADPPPAAAEAFLEGYDTAVEQLARLVDFPWHERGDDHG